MIAIWIMDQKLIKIFIFILSFSFVQSQSAKLIWSDEFNGDGSVNSANWFHQTKLPNGLFINPGDFCAVFVPVLNPSLNLSANSKNEFLFSIYVYFFIVLVFISFD